MEEYYYVRFRWWRRVDLPELSGTLGRSFKVEMSSPPRSAFELSLRKDERDELIVRADTLIARLSAFRAVLLQKGAAPFTARDMELRKNVFELYPRARPTPFPWHFSDEPPYEVAE
jgi:hypothetical protein